MSTLIAIDPGLVCTGVATFDGSRLIDVNGYRSSRGPLVDRVQSIVACIFDGAICGDAATIELPTIYPHGRGKGGGNDIRDLAVLVGALISNIRGSIVLVEPACWKGQVPKEIHQARILGKLDPNELCIIESARKKYGAVTHNLIDAVGIGLYSIGRKA